MYQIACEQALQGALEAGQEKEAELATTSLEFEYLHPKSPCEMLIGGDDISNDYIILGLMLIGRNLTGQSIGSHRGIGGGIEIPGT